MSLGLAVALVLLTAQSDAPVPRQTLSEADARERSFQLERRKFWVSILGFAGTIVTISFGVKQYRRAEAWKRAEFIAREMKEFMGNAKVANALTMIDWGGRRINLHRYDKPDGSQLVRVTRQLQCHALLPHTIVNYALGSDVEERAGQAGEHAVRSFTADEAAIRDTYDAFLDGLERFASYVASDLVTIEQLRPYLGYWIEDISSETTDADDAAWNACLITYIKFYRFEGVLQLFRDFGRPIDPSGARFQGFLRGMRDQAFAKQLVDALGSAT